MWLQIYSSQSEDKYDDGPNTLSENVEDDITIPLSKLKVSEDAHGAGKFLHSVFLNLKK